MLSSIYSTIELGVENKNTYVWVAEIWSSGVAVVRKDRRESGGRDGEERAMSLSVVGYQDSGFCQSSLGSSVG